MEKQPLLPGNTVTKNLLYNYCSNKPSAIIKFAVKYNNFLGPPGLRGDRGDDGRPGIPGGPGRMGLTGRRGYDGPKGADGFPGDKGQKGPDGHTGKFYLLFLK